MKKTGTAVSALFLGAVVALAQGTDVHMPGGPGGPGRPGGGPGGFGGRGGNEMMGGRIVTGAPYSATETLTIAEKFADGNSVNTTTTALKARDSQGRTSVTETITPAAASGKAPYTRTIITDPVAGFRYELNSATMIAVQTRMPKMHPEPAGSSSSTASAAIRTATPGTTLGTVTRPNGAIVTTSSNGTSTVNGVLATHTLVTEVIPAGAIGNANPITTTRTTFISPDLKVPVQIKTVDPRVGTSDMELTNISTGEPSAAMFTVPAGYTIKKQVEGRGPGGPGGPGGFGRRGGAPTQP